MYLSQFQKKMDSSRSSNKPKKIKLNDDEVGWIISTENKNNFVSIGKQMIKFYNHKINAKTKIFQLLALKIPIKLSQMFKPNLHPCNVSLSNESKTADSRKDVFW